MKKIFPILVTLFAVMLFAGPAQATSILQPPVKLEYHAVDSFFDVSFIPVDSFFDIFYELTPPDQDPAYLLRSFPIDSFFDITYRVENAPTSTQWAVDSFFDVYFEIDFNEDGAPSTIIYRVPGDHLDVTPGPDNTTADIQFKQPVIDSFFDVEYRIDFAAANDPEWGPIMVTASVPEPGTLLLLTTGVLGIFISRRRRKS